MKVPVAVSAIDAPSGTFPPLAAEAAIDTSVGGPTVMVNGGLAIPSNVAVMPEVPWLVAVTTPEAETETAGFEDAHVASAVSSGFVPSLKDATAASCSEMPSAKLGPVADDTATDVTMVGAQFPVIPEPWKFALHWQVNVPGPVVVQVAFVSHVAVRSAQRSIGAHVCPLPE